VAVLDREGKAAGAGTDDDLGGQLLAKPVRALCGHIVGSVADRGGDLEVAVNVEKDRLSVEHCSRAQGANQDRYWNIGAHRAPILQGYVPGNELVRNRDI